MSGNGCEPIWMLNSVPNSPDADGVLRSIDIVRQGFVTVARRASSALRMQSPSFGDICLAMESSSSMTSNLFWLSIKACPQEFFGR